MGAGNERELPNHGTTVRHIQNTIEAPWTLWVRRIEGVPKKNCKDESHIEQY